MRGLVALAVVGGLALSLVASVNAASANGTQKQKPKRGLELVKKGMKAQREREQAIEKRKAMKRRLAEKTAPGSATSAPPQQ